MKVTPRSSENIRFNFEPRFLLNTLTLYAITYILRQGNVVTQRWVYIFSLFAYYPKLGNMGRRETEA